MRCIICLNERDGSLEHVFPDAMGGTLTIDRVCQPCNSLLGATVDVLLTDHALILLKRNQLGIANRTGNTPTLHRAFGLGSMDNDPDQRVRIIQDATTGHLQPSLIHREMRTKTDDGNELISVIIDASQESEIAKIIQRVRKREGFPPLNVEELTKQVESAKAQMGTIENPTIMHKMKIDTADYKRAIAKIIYEIAWLWLGELYLDDPAAARLRLYILSGVEDENIRGKIDIGSDIPPFNYLWKNESNAHIAASVPSESIICIAVRVFDAMSGMLSVTDAPDRYPAFSTGRFFCCDPQTGSVRDTSLPDEVLRLSRLAQN